MPRAGQGRGIAVRQSTIGKQTIRAAIGVLLAGVIWSPAVAQVTFGSPGDPPRIALGAGAFDITSSRHKDSNTAAELRADAEPYQHFMVERLEASLDHHLAMLRRTAGTAEGAEL